MATGLSPSHVIEKLQNAGERTARALNFTSTPLLINGSRVQAIDFAGLMRAGPAIEIEIAPKFLGGQSDSWREDFFFLAMLSKHGRLLGTERLRALSSSNSDFATLVARALVQMFWDQHRRPIRTFRRQVVREFALEGDIDAEELRVPNEDGFAQTVVRFDRVNPFNAAIKAAAIDLVPIVRDAEVRANLGRIANYLGEQAPPRGLYKRRLPSRARSWQSTFDLALDVLQGFGLTYESGKALAPGFVLNTWRVWEDLVTVSLRANLGGQAVASQKGIHLGHRQRQSDDGSSIRRSFEVTPDLRVDGSKAGFGEILVDAKYKGRWDSGKQRIAEADVYEAMAFARAARASQVILVHPKIARDAVTKTGTAGVFERVDVDELQIWGIEVEVRGIAKIGGLRAFADGLVDQLRTIHALSKANP
ncbi:MULTISPECIES: hypothetical protein [Alphaproteobacteria]|uniref:5-methylcytosine restriction system specificity protein McrC n=1 Tax=Alphaproteobacteria TaxID=28211 RepID=UPI003298EB65